MNAKIEKNRAIVELAMETAAIHVAERRRERSQERRWVDTQICMGISQTFKEMFTERTDEDWALLGNTYASTVKMLAAAAKLPIC